jgi:hypothetical protein
MKIKNMDYNNYITIHMVSALEVSHLLWSIVFRLQIEVVELLQTHPWLFELFKKVKN